MASIAVSSSQPKGIAPDRFERFLAVAAIILVIGRPLAGGLLGLTGGSTRGRVGATESLTVNGPVILKVAGDLAAAKTAVVILPVTARGTARLEHSDTDAMLRHQGQSLLSTINKSRGDILTFHRQYRQPSIEHLSTLATGNFRRRARSWQATGDFRAQRHNAPLLLPALQQAERAMGAAVITYALAQQATAHQNLLHHSLSLVTRRNTVRLLRLLAADQRDGLPSRLPSTSRRQRHSRAPPAYPSAGSNAA